MAGRLVSDLDMMSSRYIRNKEIGSCFRHSTCCHAHALHNVELPLIYNGNRRKSELRKRRKR